MKYDQNDDSNLRFLVKLGSNDVIYKKCRLIMEHNCHAKLFCGGTTHYENFVDRVYLKLIMFNGLKITLDEAEILVATEGLSGTPMLVMVNRFVDESGLNYIKYILDTILRRLHSLAAKDDESKMKIMASEEIIQKNAMSVLSRIATERGM